MLFLISWPVATWACPICFKSNTGDKTAYYGTTILLLLLPFVIGITLGWWIRHWLKK